MSDDVLAARRIGTASGLSHLLALHDAVQLLLADANVSTASIEWCNHSHRMKRFLWDRRGVPARRLPGGSGLSFPRVRQLVLWIHTLLLSSD